MVKFKWSLPINLFKKSPIVRECNGNVHSELEVAVNAPEMPRNCTHEAKFDEMPANFI